MKNLKFILLALVHLVFLANSAQAHYDPNIGRWLSRDPIAERGGVNLYGFVKNDAINNWDLLGLEIPEKLKCCKITKIIDNFDTVHERHEYPISENGIWNHPTGRTWKGQMTVVCADGNQFTASIQTGGMRMRNSSIRVPSETNPLGDDSTAPSGDFSLSTSRPGKGFPVNVSATGRGDVTKHFAGYEGSHGCPTLNVQSEWYTFVELMNMNRIKFGQSSVKLRVQYPNVKPVGSRGNGKSDPPLVPDAIPFFEN